MKIGRGHKKVSDQALSEAYERLGSVWLVGEEVGMSGQSVHERLVRVGRVKRMNVFTKPEEMLLRSEYKKYRDNGKLEDFAKKIGRTKQFVCRKAKELGLTDRNAFKPYAEKKFTDPYGKYHARVRSLHGSPRKCEVCGEDNPHKWYDWANLTGNYDDPGDYKRMCRKCHRDYDRARRSGG